MKILLSNDDGIAAKGLRVLKEAVEGLGEVRVVAPDGERSAIGMAITLTKALRAKRWPSAEEEFGLALSGTPADCVKVGTSEAFGERPDWVFSGVNLGPNTGVSALYSGTVAVATEAAVAGIPSAAFSLDTFTDPRWDTAGRVARLVAGWLLEGRLGTESDTCWNVNIPNLPWEELKGVRVTRMGASRFLEHYEERKDPWGNPYYWMQGELIELDSAEDTDLRAVREGYVSLTPLGLDRTAEGARRKGVEALAREGLGLG